MDSSKLDNLRPGLPFRIVFQGGSRLICRQIPFATSLQLQTKYTSVKGQDPNNIPYDPSLSITEQVHSSIKTSLRNLRILDAPETEDDTSDYIDTLVLHSPLPTMEETMEAWTACEQYVPNRLRNLGISNCPLSVLKELYNSANIKPTVVQNRFYANTKFDIPLRQFCSENSIVYQSFWTLSANPRLVRSAEVDLLSKQADISPEAALYCLVLGLGNTVILDGTTQETHMVADLAAPTAVDKFASEHPDQWEDILKRFKTLIGQPT